MPVVNPTGFKLGNERDIFGREPNTVTKNNPSREGKILLKYSDLLRKLSKNGFLTLHEDYQQEKFYIYSFENGKKPGKFSIQILNSTKGIYKKFDTGIIDGYKVRNGIIFNEYDDSFENYLFSSGVPRCICSETPRGDNINRRIKANGMIISKFIHLVLKEI